MAVPKTLSVVIPTHNRCPILELSLAALLSQPVAVEKVEIIVVDDGSIDATPELVQRIGASSAVELRYLYQQQQGAGAARNRGLQQAKAPVVLFMDDDIIASPGLLAEHMRSHHLHPEHNIAILGHVALAPEIPATPLNLMHAVHRWQSLQDGQEVDWWCFFTGNTSVKRGFFLENQLFFDESLPRYQDTDLGYRCREKGLRIFYNASGLGYHYHDLTFDAFLRISQRYGEALAVLHHKYPELKTELGEYFIFSWRNPPKRLVRDLARPLVSNQLIMKPLGSLACRAEASHRTVPTFVLVRVANYYERHGYRCMLRKIRTSGTDVERGL